MPSPLAHTTVGYIIYRIYQPQKSQPSPQLVGPWPRLLLATMALSMLPDVDSLAGILLGDLERYHNNGTHSLVVGLGVALSMGGLTVLKRQSRFMKWFLITLLCYELHVIMDFFTLGRGVMAFWPLSSNRFLSPWTLFYGLHWSQGLVSRFHLLTLANELGFVVLVGLIIHLQGRLKRPNPEKA